MASGSLQGWLADAVGLDTLGDEDAEGLPKQKAQSITPQHILCDACCPMGRPCCEFMFGSSQMVTYACYVVILNVGIVLDALGVPTVGCARRQSGMSL
mmetsp:Transcript_131504/g.420785  ORF Transcript_131504/g.420785 Transcript_131504/m.420785 type:complete len:98 (-) Transcript_131504:148-441(-)